MAGFDIAGPIPGPVGRPIPGPTFDVAGPIPGPVGNTLLSAGNPYFDFLESIPGTNLFSQLGSQQGALQGQGGLANDLLTGILAPPTYGEAMPGASSLPPSQAQQSDQRAQQLLQNGPVQPDPNVGTAIGSGLRSLFDGVVGLTR